MTEEKNNFKKDIDESWKEQAEKEKDSLSSSQESQEETLPEEIDFNGFITSLGVQAMIFLGEIPNPLTKKQELNLSQAKFIIDTLVMLKEKTKGNLSKEELNLLDNFLYELQMKFVEKNK